MNATSSGVTDPTASETDASHLSNQDDSSNRTAFLLPGGGSLGAVQVGMLKALEEHGIRASMYLGSSVGAVNAAYLASGPSSETIPGLEQIWLSIRKSQIFPANVTANLWTLLGMRNHISDSSGLRRLLEKNLKYTNLEDAHVPVAVSTTNILTGQYRVIKVGPAVEAVLASAAIPAIYPPVQWENDYLVDGSVAGHIPLEPALEAGIQRVIVLPTGFTCSRTEPPRGPVSMALQSVHIMLGRQLHTAIQLFGSKMDLIVVPPLCPVDTLMNDFNNTADFIQRAYDQTRTWLGSQLPVNVVPPELEPHRH